MGDQSGIERARNAVYAFAQESAYGMNRLAPRCGWCYGTGKATRPGRAGGRMVLDTGTCPKCDATGEADGGKWNVLRTMDRLVEAAR